jgi:hypothetical protein
VVGLGAGTIDFEIVHDDVAFAIQAEVDERVGHEHANGIKHIRVVFAIRNHEQVLASHRRYQESEERSLSGIFPLVHKFMGDGSRKFFTDAARKKI